MGKLVPLPGTVYFHSEHMIWWRHDYHWRVSQKALDDDYTLWYCLDKTWRRVIAALSTKQEITWPDLTENVGRIFRYVDGCRSKLNVRCCAGSFSVRLRFSRRLVGSIKNGSRYGRSYKCWQFIIRQPRWIFQPPELSHRSLAVLLTVAMVVAQ